MLLSSPIPTQRKSEILFASPIARMLRLSVNHRTEMLSEDFYNALRTEIDEVISLNNIELLSFDVFDTALIRRKQCEARRFYEVAKMFAEQEQSFSVADAFASRVSAARIAYGMAISADDGTREGKFEMIATIVCDQLMVPDKFQQYVNIEIEFEKNNLTANPLIKRIIEDYPHLRIVFISDMYLGHSTINSLLEDSYGKVEIFSSADGNGSKRSGGLFHYVAKKTNIKLCNFLHFGDSLEGDFRAIRKLGGHSIYMPLPEAEQKAREACYSTLQEEISSFGIDLSSLLPFNC